MLRRQARGLWLAAMTVMACGEGVVGEAPGVGAPPSAPMSPATPAQPTTPMNDACAALMPATASASADDGHAPTNVSDGSLLTRWSADGRGSWLQYDFGAEHDVCFVSVAWFLGNQRSSDFVISVSSDGASFTEAYRGTSTGLTVDPERYVLGAMKARYLRLTVLGNTQDNIAAITELAVNEERNPGRVDPGTGGGNAGTGGGNAGTGGGTAGTGGGTAGTGGGTTGTGGGTTGTGGGTTGTGGNGGGATGTGKVLQATPSNISSVVSSASSGDIVVLAAGTYSTFPVKAGVIMRAVDHAVGRVVSGTTGYMGQGMAVKVTTPLNISASNVTLEGIFHDTRGYSGINAGVITGNNVHFHDCVAAARPTSGARQIGYTLGTAQTRVTGFRFWRGRHLMTGQAGQNLDHAFYIKNAADWEIADSIITDGGEYPIHLYTNGDSGRVVRTIIWNSRHAVTFSGASDASTGSSAYNTSDNNVIEDSILGRGSEGYLVETWTSDSSRPVSGNVVRNSIITKGGGAAGTYKAMSGVSVTNCPDIDPGFRDWQNGDFRNASNYGPTYLH